MPLPMIGRCECFQHYLMCYRDLLSKPQFKSFVIVLLGFIPCQQNRTLSGLRRCVAEAGSLVEHICARWDSEVLFAESKEE